MMKLYSRRSNEEKERNKDEEKEKAKIRYLMKIKWSLHNCSLRILPNRV